MNNGDNHKNRENSRPSDQNRRRKNETRRSAQKVTALTGLGVRVEILAQGVRESKCRRLQDGKEITVSTAELILQQPSDPVADRPRELFQHSGVRWRDPAEIP